MIAVIESHSSEGLRHLFVEPDLNHDALARKQTRKSFIPCQPRWHKTPHSGRKKSCHFLSAEASLDRIAPCSWGSPPPDSQEVPIGDPNPVSREFECVRRFYGLATRASDAASVN